MFPGVFQVHATPPSEAKPGLIYRAPLMTPYPPAIERRCPVRIWFTLAVLFAIPRAVWSVDRPPNVLLVVADDLRADVTSVYGGPVRTPNLDALALRGSVFDRATCGYPICHVSRAELITGRCLVTEATTGRLVPLRPEWSLWPEVMRRAGWHTVHSGKWHVEGTPRARGYETTSRLYSGGGATGRPLTLETERDRTACDRLRRMDVQDRGEHAHSGAWRRPHPGDRRPHRRWSDRRDPPREAKPSPVLARELHRPARPAPLADGARRPVPSRRA